MARAGVCVLAATALVCLLVVAPCANADVDCNHVSLTIAPCLNYVIGIGPVTPACCNGVRELNAEASTTPARQETCNCLKSICAGVPGIDPGLVAGLPAKCGVNLPYPISPSVDCSKIR